MLQSKDIGYQSGLKHRIWDAWVAQGVEHLPLTQGVILGSQDRVPHRPPLGEPASPSAYVSASASLCISHEKINKIFKSQKERGKTKKKEQIL